eukprot:Gb_39509 [translate_table: standard]
MGRDPAFWRESLEFFPNRFGDDEMDYKGHNFELISGQEGGGLPLANHMLLLLVVSLLHSFEWTSRWNSDSEMDMIEKFGITF